MDKKLYSRPIDVNRLSEYPEVQKVISTLFERLESSDLLRGSPKKGILKHLKAVVLDLYIAYDSDPETYLGYPRAKSNYAKESRMGSLFFRYRPMIRVIDGLETLGYLENHIGFYDHNRKSGYQSRMKATPALIDLIKTEGVTPFMVSYDIGEVVLLRDADGKDLSFPETEETKVIADQVRSYNQFLSEHRISVSLEPKEVRALLLEKNAMAVDYSRTQLCRVFQEGFSSGGRYYRGWWQEVPSELRKYITIDGENCSELDYSGQSLGLLYAYKDHERTWLKGDVDPYLIEGEAGVDRKLMKKVFLTCVNAASRDQAVRSIRFHINKEYDGLTSTTVFIDRLINQTTQNHPDIAEYFFSSAWAGLQYQDSEIARYVLEGMQANGYVALPIHDSFVVQNRHLAQLFSLMKEAYRMLGVSSIPDIKLEKGANADSDASAFIQLQELMDYEQKTKERELQALKALEDYVDSDPDK